MNPRYYIRHMQNLGLIKEAVLGACALDLGCGRGEDSAYLASLGYIVTSVDVHSHFPGTLIADVRTFPIEPGKYAVIICNNVLPFISDKRAIVSVIRSIADGLKPGGTAFFTLYGPHSGFKGRKDMTFFAYEEVLEIVQTLPVEIMDQTTSEGYTRNGKGEIIYQHSHRFMLRKK